MTRHYTDADKTQALELYAADGLAAAHHATRIPRSTISGWARIAGIEPGRTTDKTAAATAVAAAARAAERQEVSDYVLGRLARKSAHHVETHLDRQPAAIARLDEALVDYDDAVAALRAQRELDPTDEDATKALAARVLEARHHAATAQAACLDVRSLVGIISRGVHDHLALEGIAQVADEDGSLVVELVLPPRRFDDPVPAHELPAAAGDPPRTRL
jgi:hypothetical protein